MSFWVSRNFFFKCVPRTLKRYCGRCRIAMLIQFFHVLKFCCEDFWSESFSESLMRDREIEEKRSFEETFEEFFEYQGLLVFDKISSSLTHKPLSDNAYPLLEDKRCRSILAPMASLRATRVFHLPLRRSTVIMILVLAQWYPDAAAAVAPNWIVPRCYLSALSIDFAYKFTLWSSS